MRRPLVALISTALLAWPFMAVAQQPLRPTAPAEAQPAPSKVFRVGVLTPQSSNEPATLQRIPLERGLRDLGWKPGSDILIEYRYAEGSRERLERDASDLVARKVDLIITRGTAATRAAQVATKTIPIVMAAVPDPIREGFAQSLNRPGGNITGIGFLSHGPLEGKQLELMKDSFPTIRTVALLWNPETVRVASATRANVDVAAKALGFSIQTFEVRDPRALASAFTAIAEARVDALLVSADPHILEPNREQITAQAHMHRLPAIYPWRLYPEAGGLMSFGASIPGWHYRSASYVDRILKGIAPGDLPIEHPTTYELVLNMKTARELGISFPPSLLLRADEVIE
jgi:putative tryptophan/tyrosine transport system substrate-binding protein